MTDGSLAQDLSSVLGLRDGSIDEALRHLDSRLGREGSESDSRLRVLSDSGWALQGGETATRVFTVAGTASDRVTLILKTCVSSAMGSSASTMEAWLSRRRLIDEAGVATPSLYAVSGGTILEDFIDHNLWTFLRDRPDKECESVVKSLARLSLGLDDLGFNLISAHDFRSDGERAVMIDFGSDLGQPNRPVMRSSREAIVREIDRLPSVANGMIRNLFAGFYNEFA